MAFTRSTILTVTSDTAKLSATQTSFAVPVAQTHVDWKTIANGGYVANANGYDIRFFSDAALTTALTFELESYNATTGAIVFHVLLASCAVGTVFYCAWGDASLTTNASSTSTWDSNFKLVLHVPDGTTLGTNDSTSNAKNATNHGGGATTGKLGGGLTFTAGAQYMDGTALSASAFTTHTVSGWLKPNGNQSPGSSLATDQYGGNINWTLHFWNNDSAGLKILGAFYNGAWRRTTPEVSVTDGVWTHAAYTYDGSTLTLYVNGVSSATLSYSGTPATDALSYRIGKRWDNNDTFKGDLDEIRVSNTARSASWILAEYHSQNDPATFVTFSTPTGLGAAPAAFSGFFALMGS